MTAQIALKIDVDTYRGIAEGTPRLAEFLHSRKIPASFFVSLGPDNSGWAIKRVFRHSGFLKKMQRTSAVSLYGWRTAFSGTLLPARPMAASFTRELCAVRDAGFEISPHGYDHIRWHDEAALWSEDRAAAELAAIVELYRAIFGTEPRSLAAPGWQAGAGVWKAAEHLHLLYHSDTRGAAPYWPIVDGVRLKTLEIPTTMPTWDEMLAWDGVTMDSLVDRTVGELRRDALNVWTIHAEVEGTGYFKQFEAAIRRFEDAGVDWIFLPRLAQKLAAEGAAEVRTSEFVQATRLGRAGTVTCQKGT